MFGVARGTGSMVPPWCGRRGRDQGAEVMLQDATFWVALAFVIFVVLSYRKLSSLITGALDQRGERIRQELEEAQRLREDA